MLKPKPVMQYGFDVAANGDTTMVRTTMGGDGTINIVAANRWSAEEIYRMSKEIALKTKFPVYLGHPKTAATGIVHDWSNPWPWKFGTILDYKGQGLRVMYLAKGRILNLKHHTIDTISEGTFISDWKVVEEAPL